MELSVMTDHKRLEDYVLQETRETTLNGHIIEKEVTAPNGCISVEDIDVKIKETCHLCGQMLSSKADKNKEKNGNGLLMGKSDDAICEECMTPTESAEGNEEVETENKRDSGFHTLNREERDNPSADTDQQSEAALSSSSSADSAISMGTCVRSDHTVNGEGRETYPGIVVESCSRSRASTPNYLKEDLDLSQKVFLGSPKKESPKTIAEKLFKFDGYKRTEIARMLGKNSEHHRQVAKEYLQFFNFTSTSLIDAYREFLSHFALLGETQERERILLCYSQRYLECNPEFLDQNPDSVHTLVCALTLLNTDLHGNIGLSSGRKKMTYKEFATNLSGLMSNNDDYPKDLLLSLYSSVKKHPLPWGGKEPKKIPRSTSVRQNTGNGSHRVPTKIVNRSLSTRPLFKSGKVAVDSTLAGLGRSVKLKPLSHNQGLLWRKLYLDSDEKKVSIGKRGWKVYSVTLQNLVLHIVKKGTTESKAVSIHHCLAEESRTDSKRPHVFRVTLADSSVTLYQANSDKEARKWIRAINKAAALLSATPLCSPVGSQMVFRRALLPSAPSTLPPSNQLNTLHGLLKEQEHDLAETQREAETEKSHSEQQDQYYRDKIAYLKSEVRKYDCYVKIIQMHLRTSSATAEETRSNLESSNNGSLVSVTPSEPPLASPSAFDNSDVFSFPESVLKYETNSFLSPPAHLASSRQYRSLTLSPTSSLPNLSPIPETPTKGSAAGNQTHGSLQRRHRREMYESSLNGGTPPGRRNANNSNSSHLRQHRPVASSTRNQPYKTQSSDQNHVKVRIQTSVIGLQTLPGNQESFPVRRFDMRITDMAPEHVSPTVPHNSKPDLEARTRLVGESSISNETPTESRCYPTVENRTLSRVKGRIEKRGIERYSYMQAITRFDES